MPGAPKQFDQNDVLEKALQVFWANGYESTSMQDLVDAMGVNRASMYDTFGNKRELFLASFKRYCEQSANNIRQTLSGSGLPLDNLKALFLNLSQQAHGGVRFGCFANNVAIEFGTHDSELASQVRTFWQIIEEAISENIQAAINQGQLEKTADSLALAKLINTIIQGLAAKTKAGVDQEHIKAAVTLLFGMLPYKKPA